MYKYYLVFNDDQFLLDMVKQIMLLHVREACDDLEIREFLSHATNVLGYIVDSVGRSTEDNSKQIRITNQFHIWKIRFGDYLSNLEENMASRCLMSWRMNSDFPHKVGPETRTRAGVIILSILLGVLRRVTDVLASILTCLFAVMLIFKKF